MQMVGLPDDHLIWINLVNPEELHEVLLQLVGDPYFPYGLSVGPPNLPEEEDPLEDEKEDYIEEVEDYEDEGILQDAQQQMDDDGPVEDEEGLTDEESAPPTPPSSPYKPCYQPCRHHGKSHILMRTMRMHVPQVYHLETFAYVSRLIIGQKR